MIANGDFAAGLEKAGDVTVGGVVRDAAHRDDAAPGQRDIEQLRPVLRVLEEQLVEIAQAEQEQGILGQLGLDAAVLRHHRGELRVAGH